MVGKVLRVRISEKILFTPTEMIKKSQLPASLTSPATFSVSLDTSGDFNRILEADSHHA